MLTSALASLDAFLVDIDTGRDVTRLLRRAFFDRKHLIVLGEPAHARAFILRLAETFPVDNRHLIVCDEAGHEVRAITGREVSSYATEATTAAMMRSALRQDPDTVMTTSLAGAHELFVNTALTGHQAIGALLDVHALAAVEHLAHLTPWVLALDADGRVQSLVELDHVLTRIEHVTRDGTGYRKHTTPSAPVEPAAPPRPEQTPNPEAIARGESALAARQRPAWRLVVDADERRPSRIGARSLRWPKNEAWPVCATCARPLFPALQLDGTTLPETLRSEGVVSLLVCTHGCDNTKSGAPGVVCRVLKDLELVELAAPEDVDSKPRDEGRAGGVASFARITDHPSSEERHAIALDQEASEAVPSRGGDKLGGWPAWVQGDETPACPHCAQRMAPLVQLDDSPAAHTPGRPTGWDDDRADVVPGEPRRPLFVDSEPVHLPGLFTFDARAWIFRCATHTNELTFLWQT